MVPEADDSELRSAHASPPDSRNGALEREIARSDAQLLGDERAEFLIAERHDARHVAGRARAPARRSRRRCCSAPCRSVSAWSPSARTSTHSIGCRLPAARAPRAWQASIRGWTTARPRRDARRAGSRSLDAAGGVNPGAAAPHLREVEEMRHQRAPARQRGPAEIARRRPLGKRVDARPDRRRIFGVEHEAIGEVGKPVEHARARRRATRRASAGWSRRSAATALFTIVRRQPFEGDRCAPSTRTIGAALSP